MYLITLGKIIKCNVQISIWWIKMCRACRISFSWSNKLFWVYCVSNLCTYDIRAHVPAWSIYSITLIRLESSKISRVHTCTNYCDGQYHLSKDKQNVILKKFWWEELTVVKTFSFNPYFKIKLFKNCRVLQLFLK